MKLLSFIFLFFAIILEAFGAARAEAVVFTQVPESPFSEVASPDQSPIPIDYSTSRLMIRDENGRLMLLSEGFVAAADPDVSFNGKKVLFAGKKSANQPWNIFEINVDGTGLRQITRNAGNCRNPVYLSTFYTIVSTEPWYLIAFSSDLAGELTGSEGKIARDLYSCRLDGSELQRLTYNPSSDRDPFVLKDGRILFSASREAIPARGQTERAALFATNSDGTDLVVFSAREGLPFKRMPTVTLDGVCVFVESETDTGNGAGRLGSVRMRRNLHSYRSITSDDQGLFYSPAPLGGSSILVSHRPASENSTYALCRLDTELRTTEVIYDDPEYHELQGRVVAKRPEPDGRSSVVNTDDPHGQFYALNIAISDLPELTLAAAHRVRVLEGIPRTSRSPYYLSTGPEEPDLLKKRVLGEVDIESDGSFFMEVPANIPIQLQLLDDEGYSVRTCDWIWVRNHEPRGCIGCHEDPERTPPNRLVQAVEKDPYQLTLPVKRRRVVDFRRDIAPVVASKCSVAACHSSTGPAPVFSQAPQESQVFATDTYKALLKRTEGRALPDFVHPGRARTSPVLWHLLGHDTRQSWDDRENDIFMPYLKSSGLTQLEMRLLIEWIDFGAHWSSLPLKETAQTIQNEDPMGESE